MSIVKDVHNIVVLYTNTTSNTTLAKDVRSNTLQEDQTIRTNAIFQKILI